MAETPKDIFEAMERYSGGDGLLNALRDAERYRWLKSNGRSDSDILWDYQGEELDRVIDSEIAREGANA